MRHCNGMTHADRNILLTTGAQIQLEGVVRLNTTRLDFAVQVFPNITCHIELPEKCPADKCNGNNEGHRHKPDIALAGYLFACRIKTHESSIA